NSLKPVINATPLQYSFNLSEKYGANIYLKREDTQIVRSYKIRGAYNKISSLSQQELENGIVCASAGNHAQGVAFSCNKLQVKGTIFMPAPTPKQKVEQVKMFGKEHIEVRLVGDTFDDAYQLALSFQRETDSTFIHPFNDEKVIEGQGTVGLEIFNEADFKVDYLFLPVGGGGLSAGVSSVLKLLSPNTKMIGVEPAGAPAMHDSFQQNKLVKLNHIDKFVDGAAVKEVGNLTFPICKENLEEMALVDEGKLCSTLISMYNQSGIVLEPAGALSVAVLDDFAAKIKGKNVICLLSGSNNDITRTEEIRERSLLFEGLMHYFIIGFPQRAGALKEFVAEVLGPTDDIVHFEYTKKTSREKGPALVGIELKNKEDFGPLLERMKSRNFLGEYLNEKPDLFSYLI
ncbi:MAG: threonine ammonia-lyase, partial [Cyclobacteriaceae bacterium]|nr:threonine ammonia-lyase [Cyclobacteriaceae bacterium HetDA_MAG_MS6]